MIGDTPSFIAAAHELKAPLVLIRQLAIALQASDVDAQEALHIIQQIQLTSERSLRLTTDLTKYARLEDALFELEPINPVALCEDVAYELRPLFAAHGKTIRAKSRRKPLLMVGNRDLLHRIITNFSDNALHYTAEDSTVEISAQQIGKDRIRVSVRDYGPALSMKAWRSLQEKLASPQPVHARPQSSGLGIHIASNFAKVMNGEIGVVRHRDGASFYVEASVSSQMSLL